MVVGGGGSICVPGVGLGFFFFSVGCWEADGALRSGPAALPSPPSAASGYFGAFYVFPPFFPLRFSGAVPGDAGSATSGREDGAASHVPPLTILYAASRIPHLVPQSPHPSSHGVGCGGRGRARGGAKATATRASSLQRSPSSLSLLFLSGRVHPVPVRHGGQVQADLSLPQPPPQPSSPAHTPRGRRGAGGEERSEGASSSAGAR